jgi:hypothetical protein
MPIDDSGEVRNPTGEWRPLLETSAAENADSRRAIRFEAQSEFIALGPVQSGIVRPEAPGYYAVYVTQDGDGENRIAPVPLKPAAGFLTNVGFLAWFFGYADELVRGLLTVLFTRGGSWLTDRVEEWLPLKAPDITYDLTKQVLNWAGVITLGIAVLKTIFRQASIDWPLGRKGEK